MSNYDGVSTTEKSEKGLAIFTDGGNKATRKQAIEKIVNEYYEGYYLSYLQNQVSGMSESELEVVVASKI